MIDLKKIKSAVVELQGEKKKRRIIKNIASEFSCKDARVIAIRNMIALAKAKGTPGETGQNGIDGMRGADGVNGINGMQGTKGLDGLKGETGPVGPQGEKGEAGMIWRGTYRNNMQYEIGDVVGVSGSAYVCVAATNQAPPVGFGWELLVSRGAQGIRGIKGENGGGAAAAGTLTGDTLAANVLASSLTQIGTLEFLNVTNTISGSISGNAATATSALTAATVTTAAQPTITSVGTLTSLTTSSDITFTELNGTSAFGLGGGFSRTNVALGGALQSCTPDESLGEGLYNLGIGAGSLYAITTGNYNTAIGSNSLLWGQTCSQNIAIGSNTMQGSPVTPITGNYNIGIGNLSCASLTTNGSVIGIGRDSFYHLSTGNSSIAIGLNAGKWAISTTALTNTTSSIYIGVNSKASAATGNTNEIVIGSNALGLGSNTSVLGNSSTTASTVYGVLTPSKGLLAPAGTTTIAPIKLQSGTNLTTPTSGVIEFDGNAMYGTVASGRGLIPTEQFSIITTTKGLNSSAVAQNVFDTPEDTITLALDTAYSFEGFFSIVSGTTSHTTSINLYDATFGSETISWRWMAMGHSSAAGNIIRTQDTVVFTTNGGVITSSSLSALTTIWFRGIVIVTSAGVTPLARSVVPQITFSAAPGGTNEVAVGSFIRFVPLGSNLVKSVGPWS